MPATEVRFWEDRFEDGFEDDWSTASLEAADLARDATAGIAAQLEPSGKVQGTHWTMGKSIFFTAGDHSAAEVTVDDDAHINCHSTFHRAISPSAGELRPQKLEVRLGEAADSFCSMAWIRQELADLRSDVSSLVMAVHGLDRTEKPGCMGVDLAETAHSLFSTAWARQEFGDLHSDVSSLATVVHGLGHRLDHAVPSSLLRAEAASIWDHLT